MREHYEWPDWLKVADTEGARVEIVDGRVIWRGGTWYGGTWYGGTWHGGIWRGGDWHGGIWRGGIWRGGIWRGGTWHGGIWLGGDWRGGNDNPTRTTFRIVGHHDTIFVGCKRFTLDEAEALCEGGDLPREAPARDSEAGRLLRAAVLAQITWQRALDHGD
ncbi:MAG: hypothetical protein RQ750_16865 [Roseovarius sp.]|nr:hypothetical protein [Roseovarius sp.]